MTAVTTPVALPRRLTNTLDVAIRARVERGVPHWPVGRLAERQRRRVHAIVRHAYESVPFYAAAMRERGLTPRDIRTSDDLGALPLLEPATVRAMPAQFVSSRVAPAARRALVTSGTQSGRGGQVWWDEGSLLHKLAYLERDRGVIAALLGRGAGHRQLYILPHGSQSLLLRQWWDAWTVTPPRLATRTVEPADAPYDYLAARIAALRPDVVYSYGSFADHFARWLAASALELTAPRVWCYGGDGMSAAARARLERRTGAVVHSTYQSAEMGRIGFECERRTGFHLNTDLCAVRVADAAGTTVPAGVEGELVLSNLHNRATVLLNYRLGDRGVLASAPCGCGRTLPLLAALRGRQTEVVRLADGRQVSGLVVEGLCTSVHSATLQSQLVFDVPGQVTLRVVLAPGADPDALERAVREIIARAFGSLLHVRLERVTALPTAAHGKFARVVPREGAVGEWVGGDC